MVGNSECIPPTNLKLLFMQSDAMFDVKCILNCGFTESGKMGMKRLEDDKGREVSRVGKLWTRNRKDEGKLVRDIME